MKKSLSLILALLMTALSFASCSAKPETEAPAASPVTSVDPAPGSPEPEDTAPEEEVGWLDDLPEVMFDGADFVIYSANELSNDWWLTNYTDFAEDSEDVLESAIYRRNRLAEERFDIRISETIQPNAVIKEIITAGDNTMQLCLLAGSNSLSMAQTGYLYDQKKLEHIDLTKPYWDQNAVNDLTIAGKLYHSTGDFITTHRDGAKVFFFNKGLIDDYNLSSPYGYVDENHWTIDTMRAMVKGVSLELIGDGVFNDQDRWGILSQSGAIFPALVFGAGEQFVTKDENDKPVVSFYTDRFVRVFEAIVDMCHAEGDTVMYNANRQNTMGLSHNHRVQEIMFPNNQALFWNENIAWAKALRDMEMDFGIIPAPKLDEEQDRYYNVSAGSYFGMNIPVSAADPEYVSIVLEGLNSMSYGLVTDAYYEVMLKSKLSRDEDSGRMLDIIFDSLVYDVSIVYGLANIKDKISDMLANSDMDLASYFKSNSKLMTKSIDKTYDKIKALNH